MNLKFWKKESNSITKIAKKELRKNIDVVKSLRDYDQGKKDISTTRIEKRMRDLQRST